MKYLGHILSYMGRHPERTSSGKLMLREVRTNEEFALERTIRDEVFIKEQSVPYELEFENEELSTHFILWASGRAVGCGRFRWVGPDIKLERIAVLRSERGNGYGTLIVKGLLEEVRGKGPSSIYLNSQTSVKGFYERCGFRPVGEEFLEAGIWHIRMMMDRGGNKG